MGLSKVSVVVFWVCVQLMNNLAEGLSSCHQNHVSNYISWKDLWVDEQRLTRDPIDDSRVIVVDQHGRGHSRTVQGAVDMVPDNNSERIKIYIYPGIYRERVYVPRAKGCVSMIGGRNETAGAVITWNSKSSDRGFDGQELGTYASSTVTVESDYFCATRLTFENSAVAVNGGNGMQGVALRVDSERAVFYRVRIKGEQDTLLDNTGTHYFYHCHIQGKIDFIFGHAKSLYQNCHLHSIAETYGAIAAHHRDTENEDTGFSFVNCSITGTGSVYLGRAWGDYSRIIYSFCYMDDIIIPEGWTDWNHPDRQMTAVFGEYQCEGDGADRRGRVEWSKCLSYEEARPFLDKSFINGDQWLRL
ncbi:pectinesterase QRT1-like [Neltuma alba]|uniref:pectinesterase QRT1-like n=1 Tax=Neltuma alba TaxID=207710 RepID=UPI0010A4683B|nr:pectinesterase QRT1-like [Prosopis alba]